MIKTFHVIENLLCFLLQAKWPYDPHHGFFIDNALISKAKNKPIYRCVARHPKGYQTDASVYIWKPYNAREHRYKCLYYTNDLINALLLVISTESEVKIRPPPRHIVANQPFKLNCSTTYYQQQNVSLELHWLIPNRLGIDVGDAIALSVTAQFDLSFQLIRA